VTRIGSFWLKLAAVATGATFILGGGNCLPEDFWSELAGSLTADVISNLAGTVLDSVIGGLTGAAG